MEIINVIKGFFLCNCDHDSCHVHVFTDEEFPEGYKAFCPYCPAAFTNKQDLIKHFQEEHGKTPAGNYPIMLCDMCCFVSQNSYTTFKQHREYHKLSLVYKCTRCLFLSPSPQGILRHATNTFCNRHDLVQIEGSQSPVPINEVESSASIAEVTKSAKTYSRKNKAKPLTMNGHTTSGYDSDGDTVKVTRIDDSESHTQIKTDSSEKGRPPIKLKISLSPDKPTNDITLGTSPVINRHKSKPANLVNLSPSKRPVFTPPSHTRSSRVVIPSKRVLEDIVDRTEERERKLRKLDSCHRVSADIQTVQTVTQAQVETESPPDSWVDKVKSSSREVQEIKSKTSLRTMLESEEPAKELELRKVCPFDSEEEMTVTESEDQTGKHEVTKSELLDKAGLTLNEPKLVLEKMPEFIELEEDTSSGGDVKPASSTAAEAVTVTTDIAPSSEGRSVSIDHDQS